MGTSRDEHDDITPSEPPPSYTAAISSNNTYSGVQAASNSEVRPDHLTPPMPGRPTDSSSSSYSRPPMAPAWPSASTSSSAAAPQQFADTSGLYTANEDLPFRFPKGYFCKKCKNSGYKTKYTKYCSTCWEKFYLNEHAYNPNTKLPFKYPKRYFCSKCNNTGTKLKKGKLCKKCYERFAPRGFIQPQSTSNAVPFTSSSTTFNYAPPINTGPLRVEPGDPRLGGTLCERCRGSGVTHFLLDTDLCPVCHGLGRILNGAPPQMGPFPNAGFPPSAGFPPPAGYSPGPGFGGSEKRPY